MPKSKNMPLVVALGMGVLALGLCASLYYNMRLSHNVERQTLLAEQARKNQEKLQMQLDQQNTVPTSTVQEPEQTTDALGNYTLDTSSPYLKNYSANFTQDSFEIQWNHGAKPVSASDTLAFLKQIDSSYSFDDFKDECDNDAKCRLFMYEAGKISSPAKLSGKTLYIVSIPTFGMGGVSYYDELAFFDENTKRFIIVKTDPNAYTYQTPKEIYGGFIAHAIPSLEKPSTLAMPNAKTTLAFVKSGSKIGVDYFSNRTPKENRGGILDAETGEMINYSVYTSKNLAFTDAKYGPVYFYDRAYHIILPDGSVQIYELIPPFLSTNIPEGADKNMFTSIFTANVQWSDGRKQPTNYYSIGGNINVGKCAAGIELCTNVVNANSWFKEANLVQVGKTNTGDPIYELKDAATNPYYKQLFDYGYAASKMYPGDVEKSEAITQEQFDAMPPQAKMADFIADHPLFFWKDQSGNWRVYQKAKYRSLVECGKPVIYLYPTTETVAHVEVNPMGGFTKTEPAYGTQGWTVTAKPDGTLKNKGDGKMYPYLFWEGIGYNYHKSTQGFVLNQKNVDSEMKTILAKLGLNEKETKDFMEFWSSKLKTKPYVFVTFVSQNEFDNIAPLSVSPKPDTVIRVFMDYTPLDKPTTVSPLQIKTPERKGFTVVEWGGALHH